MKEAKNKAFEWDGYALSPEDESPFACLGSLTNDLVH